jgi:hypothetical protein
MYTEIRVLEISLDINALRGEILLFSMVRSPVLSCSRRDVHPLAKMDASLYTSLSIKLTLTSRTQKAKLVFCFQGHVRSEKLIFDSLAF